MTLSALDRPLAPAEPSTPSLDRREVAAVVGALVAWSALVLVAWRLGEPNRIEWKLRGAPIAGFYDRHLTVGTPVALLVGLGAAAVLPTWVQRTSWRRLVVGTCLLALGWGTVLGLARGPAELGRGLESRHEYPAVVAEVERVGVARFVDTFTDDDVLSTYPIHVQGHPVGAPLLYAGLDRVGLGGGAWAAAISALLGATTWAALLVTVREVAGARLARSLAPFAVLAPAAVWMVASADAVFAAVGAWGVALLALASSPSRSGREALGLAVGAGLVWGIGIHLSYGLPPVFLVGVAVVASRRRWPLLGWTALGGAAVVALAWAGGFFWFDGLAATHVRYWSGIASVRPRGFFTLVGNPAAFGLAVGPAAAVALALVRDRRLWILGGAGLGAVLLANASGLSKAEVERIWLPFAPWVLVLAAGLAERSRRLVPLLLSAQVLVAVAVESLVKTPW